MFPIIDAHIHLYSSHDIPSLNWELELRQIPSLNQENSVREYKSAAASFPSLSGFIFVETDRKSGLRDGDWGDVLNEVSFLSRVANGTPGPAETFSASDKGLLLAIVPWAPLPAGAEAMSKYMCLVKDRCITEVAWNKIKGVRYLVQDKPAGTMLQPEFIESLRWLGKHSLTFDLGVDARSGGLDQLRDACEMLRRVQDGGHMPKIIVNHLCKPNLRLSMPEARGGHPEFLQWKECIQEMASFQGTYMKLSGGFSELPPQQPGEPTDIDDLVMHLKPWIETIVESFGPTRIMFGSDWPVCNVGGPGSGLSWTHWHNLISAILDAEGLTDPEKAQIWSGTAAQAYSIL